MRVIYTCHKKVLVTVPEAAEFFLASSVPRVETNGTVVGGEIQRVHFNAQSERVVLRNGFCRYCIVSSSVANLSLEFKATKPRQAEPGDRATSLQPMRRKARVVQFGLLKQTHNIDL